MVLRLVTRKRSCVATLLASLVVLSGSLTWTNAEARHRHRYRHFAYKHHYHSYKHHLSGGTGLASPSFAAMVVDYNSGRTLYAVNENAPRHPASITKVMTLYLLFEQLENGHMNLSTPITISEHAHSQAPSKLGLNPGQSISVENAIKAIVTKSANDIAVAVAESIGDSEDDFAEMMTRKAHELGMTHTNYVNASGLPADEQITTARDLTILGRAIQERFPKYYGYFSTHSFTYAGSFMLNHNHLMDRVEGMDGIKTGYTRASGFNLLTSVHRDDHRIVAAVLGGRSASQRDQIMAGLIEQHIDDGAGVKTASIINESLKGHDDTSTDVAQDTNEDGTKVAPAAKRITTPQSQQPPQRPALAANADGTLAVPLLAASPPIIAPPVEKIRPAVVSGAPKLDVNAQTKQRAIVDGSTAQRIKSANLKTSAPLDSATPSALGWMAGPSGKIAAIRAIDKFAPLPTPVARNGRKEPAEASTATTSTKSDSIATQQTPTASNILAGRIIQIGATDDANKANALLNRAKQDNHHLANAHAYTEKVQNGNAILYRARFAGLDPESVEETCKSLKRDGFSCFTTKN